MTARFDTIELSQEDVDRVRIQGVRGEAPPPDLKVSLNTLGGFRNEMVFVLTGLAIEAKAELVKQQLTFKKPPAEVKWTLARTDHQDAAVEEEASAFLRCAVKDPDPKVVGRAFSNAAVEIALASYPGFHVTAPPGDASPYGLFKPGYVDAKLVDQVAVVDGRRIAIPPAPETRALAPVADPELPEPLTGPTRRVPLGRIAGARSGDKGGDANVGVWVRTDEAWRWLVHALTVEEFKKLLPEAENLTVTRHVFGTLKAVNFVVEGLLGDGVAAQARFDPQAKAVGEWLRARHMDIPEVLL